MSRREALFMETTSIDPSRTAAEIKAELVKAGATKIMEDYDAGRIVAITFAIETDDGPLPFRLPIRIDPIFDVINGRRAHPRGYAAADREQAERVAWRQVYRWIQAQVALVRTGMVETQEVFFPYITNGKTTVYERAKLHGFRADRLLPAGRDEGASDA